jgi:hypothetical protein
MKSQRRMAGGMIEKNTSGEVQPRAPGRSSVVTTIWFHRWSSAARDRGQVLQCPDPGGLVPGPPLADHGNAHPGTADGLLCGGALRRQQDDPGPPRQPRLDCPGRRGPGQLLPVTIPHASAAAARILHRARKRPFYQNTSVAMMTGAAARPAPGVTARQGDGRPRRGAIETAAPHIRFR